LAIIWFRFMMFNTTFNNISAISWRSVLLVGGNRSTRRKPPIRYVAILWQTVSHNVFSSLGNSCLVCCWKHQTFVSVFVFVLCCFCFVFVIRIYEWMIHSEYQCPSIVDFNNQRSLVRNRRNKYNCRYRRCTMVLEWSWRFT
jgi:uncharacterized membrane protein